MNAPRGYWVGVVLAGVFALFGLTAIVAAMVVGTAGMQQQMGFTPGMAFWALLVFAILTELIGVLGLVRRRRWAIPAFALSLFLTGLFYGYLIRGAGQAASLAGPVVITGAHAVLLWFAVYSSKRGWIS